MWEKDVGAPNKWRASHESMDTFIQLVLSQERENTELIVWLGTLTISWERTENILITIKEQLDDFESVNCWFVFTIHLQLKKWRNGLF